MPLLSTQTPRTVEWQPYQTEEEEEEEEGEEEDGEEDIEARGAAAETLADLTRMITQGVWAAEPVKAIEVIKTVVAVMEPMKSVAVAEEEEEAQATEVIIVDRLKAEWKSLTCKEHS